MQPLFNSGDRIANFTFAFKSALYSGDRYSQNLTPLAASYEVGAKDNFLDVEMMTLGLGGYASIASYRYERPWAGELRSGWDYTSTIFGGRGLLHYPFAEDVDGYGGLMLAYHLIRSKSFGDTTGLSKATGGLFITTVFGARYYFTPSIAGLLELGFGVSNFNFGITVKL